MKDRDIDYSDIPRLDKTFFKKATMAWPPAKKQLTIRLDEDVLAWLKSHGKGYQTRINRILRVVMEGQPHAPETQTSGATSTPSQSQAPIGAFEAHVSYDVKPRLWRSSRLGPQ